MAHGSRSPLEKMMLLAAERAEHVDRAEEQDEKDEPEREELCLSGASACSSAASVMLTASCCWSSCELSAVFAAHRRPRTGFGASVVEEARPSVWSSRCCAPSP